MSNGKLLVKIKKLHPEAIIPRRATNSSGGYDVYAVTKEFEPESGCIIYGTGLAVTPPEGYATFLMMRSSVYKQPLILANGVGLIDQDYTGEIKAIFKSTDRPRACYEVGDRIGQLVFVKLPEAVFEVTEELPDSIRGDGGFGSTGV